MKKSTAASADYQELSRLMEEKQTEETTLSGMMDEWESLSLQLEESSMIAVCTDRGVFSQLLGIVCIWCCRFMSAMTGAVLCWLLARGAVLRCGCCTGKERAKGCGA